MFGQDQYGIQSQMLDFENNIQDFDGDLQESLKYYAKMREKETLNF